MTGREIVGERDRYMDDDTDRLMNEAQERLRDVAHRMNPTLVKTGDPALELGELRRNVNDLITSMMQMAIVINGLRRPT